VPIRTWNKRAVQGTLVRLDQSGMIRRFRLRKRKTDQSWILCIQVQREPRDEDLENLGFKRQAPITGTTDELLQDDDDGDTLMRDLEVDMLDDCNENEIETNNSNNNLGEIVRIPPQWTPDRLLANIIFDVVALGQAPGSDSVVVRDRVVGPFWRRPMESHLTRLTDDWERTQPLHLRHLAIIRDTRNTEEKKFIHYVYRTHRFFQLAVDGGEAAWEGVCMPAAKTNGKSNQKKHGGDESILDLWGFHGLDQKSFVRFNGTATLSDVRSAIANRRRYGPRWDNALAEEIGYQKLESPVPKTKVPRRFKKASIAHSTSNEAPHNGEEQATAILDDAEDTEDQTVMSPVPGKQKISKTPKKGSGLTLTPEQRIALGLKPSGRLSKSAAKQIQAHRRETGDPTSLPDKIVEEPVIRVRAPLMTKEERLAENLPPRGRLGLEKENEIREKRGMPKLVEKSKTKRVVKEAVLTKQQRIALGLKSHGRLHQHFVDALRREQEDDIPLNESPAVEAYREFLKAGAKNATAHVDTTTTPAEEDVPRPTSEAEPDTSLNMRQPDSEPASAPVVNPGKRKANSPGASPPISKRNRTMSRPSEGSVDSSVSQFSGAFTMNTTLSSFPGDIPGNSIVITDEEAPQSLQNTPEDPRSAPAEQDQARPAKSTSHIQSDNKKSELVGYSRPGIYVYSSAKRKVGRGRPRNACILVFKTARLGVFPWFMTSSSSGRDAPQITMGACKPPPPSGNNDFGTEAISGDVAEAHGSLRLPSYTELEATTNLGMTVELEPEPLLSSADHDVNEHDLRPQSQVQQYEQVAVSENVPDNDDTQTLAEALPAQVTRSTSDAKGGDTTVSLDQSPMLATSREITGGDIISASAQVTQPSYQSPYAPIVQSDAITSVQGPAATDVAQLPTIRLGNPIPETTSLASMPEGVVGGIIEQEDDTGVSQKKTNIKSAALGVGGSALKFRREIIEEIIDLCGGVFPLHGEIWRPFSAIWDERHGHTSIAKPQSSTVSDTLKNMIINPEYNLKRMVFHVKARNAKGSKERIIVTRSNIDAHDPRVLQLAYNMANHALERSHQYYPKQIRNVFEFESSYVPLPVAPKDDTITLAQLYPELEYSIKENQVRRRKEKAAQKQAEKAAAKKQNEQVEKAIPRRRESVQIQAGPRAKRTRLASLNDKNKRYRRAVAPVPLLEVVEDVPGEADAREPSPAGTDSSEDVPLMTLRPLLVGDIVERNVDDEEAPLSDIGEEVTSDLSPHVLDLEMVSFTHPIVCFHAGSGTFATFFSLATILDEALPPTTSEAIRKPPRASGTKKRVRIDDSTTKRSSKKPRSDAVSQLETLDDEFVYSSNGDSDATSSEDEDEEARPKQQQKQKKKRRVIFKRQLGKKLPAPTLLERLTGLTGDPNDPIYKDPKYRHRSGSVQPWAVRKKKQLNKTRKEREYAEALDHTDKFKKLCLTLVLAHSMSGDGQVNWSIVEKVYARDNFFELIKVKKLWAWMQTHMSVQLAELIDTLQMNFLEAYEAGRLPEINDPDSYDWAGLVRWTMRTCTYPELPLPLYRETIDQLVVDESGYVNLDRVSWYGKKVADTVRTQLQLQLPYTRPLHKPPAPVPQSSGRETEETKARSWIRSNTATPQSMYDAHLAHEKLKVLGEDNLIKVVGNFVQQEHLKMRKIKRQLPGRNYTFTKKFAKTYKRQFELEDFMVATTVKKELDAAFANEDPEKRYYSISRCEEDGSIMAIMSLVGDGKVKLTPRLPHVDNEFGAPLPRLSKWGFCEGDYIHRAIDRNRLFWDTHVVPTSDYQFGNPLEPLPSPTADWPSLPEPPLPGKTDSGALLPIWSSIDGQSVTWPWWYRILNLVLQPLFLQPGATAADIRLHSSEHTVEVFEVELVLGWLEFVGAVTKLATGGYQVTANFWAAFGDRLRDTEDDWFGEHVKRHTKITTKQQWRDKYNLRYSTMQTQGSQRANANGPGKRQLNGHTHGGADGMGRQIVQNSKAQYRILRQALLEPVPEVEAQDTPQALEGGIMATGPEERMTTQVSETPVTHSPFEQIHEPALTVHTGPGDLPHTPIEIDTPTADVEMEDIDADADAEGEDVDAEGEVDDVDAEGEMDAEGEIEDMDAEGDEDDTMY
jgi:hypothetical protein